MRVNRLSYKMNVKKHMMVLFLKISQISGCVGALNPLQLNTFYTACVEILRCNCGFISSFLPVERSETAVLLVKTETTCLYTLNYKK